MNLIKVFLGEMLITNNILTVKQHNRYADDINDRTGDREFDIVVIETFYIYKNILRNKTKIIVIFF